MKTTKPILISNDQSSSTLTFVKADQHLDQTSSIVLPIKVLDHFDRIGKIIQKNLNEEVVATISDLPPGQGAMKRKMFNPLRLITPGLSSSLFAPVFMYKILGAVTGTGELAKINARLDQLTSKVDKMLVHQQIKRMAEIIAVSNTLNDLEAEYQETGSFSDSIVLRLALVESNLERLVIENEILVANESQVLSQPTKSLKKMAEKISNSDYHFDRQMALHSLKAKLQLGRLRLIDDLINNPAHIDRRLTLIEADLGKFRSFYQRDDLIMNLVQQFQINYQQLGRFQKWRLGKVAKELATGETSPKSQLSLRYKYFIIKEKTRVKFISVLEDNNGQTEAKG